jgi:hypothetical protein
MFDAQLYRDRTRDSARRRVSPAARRLAQGLGLALEGLRGCEKTVASSPERKEPRSERREISGR